MSQPHREKLADVLRLGAGHIQAARETARKAKEDRNREIRQRILAYRSSERMAEAMCDYLILLAREDGLQDGRSSLTETWPHELKILHACKIAVARLIAAENFKAACREEMNGGRDGFADIRVIAIEVAW